MCSLRLTKISEVSRKMWMKIMKNHNSSHDIEAEMSFEAITVSRLEESCSICPSNDGSIVAGKR